MKTASRIYTFLIVLFLYAPIIVLIVYSFNSSDSTSVLSGFSLKWYRELFQDRDTLNSLKNTLILAVLSAAVATVLGTVAAVGIDYMKKGAMRTLVLTTTNIPMMNADIVTGVSMMLLFVFIGRLLHINGVLGFNTLLIAHVTFNLPYVILSVLPKLAQIDPHIPEAARDLGCTPAKAFFKVIVPNIMPGVVTGMIMAFTLSIDDFVISYFANGPAFQTLPIRIYSMARRGVTLDMYALSTLIFVSILVLLILINLSQKKGAKTILLNQKEK